MPTAEITCPGCSYTSQNRSRRVTKVNVPRNTPLGPITRMKQLRKSRWMGTQIIQLRGGRREGSRRHPVTRRADATISLPWPHP